MQCARRGNYPTRSHGHDHHDHHDCVPPEYSSQACQVDQRDSDRLRSLTAAMEEVGHSRGVTRDSKSDPGSIRGSTNLYRCKPPILRLP
eukprot:136146-Rhodomonas_salina.1